MVMAALVSLDMELGLQCNAALVKLQGPTADVTPHPPKKQRLNPRPLTPVDLELRLAPSPGHQEHATWRFPLGSTVPHTLAPPPMPEPNLELLSLRLSPPREVHPATPAQTWRDQAGQTAGDAAGKRRRSPHPSTLPPPSDIEPPPICIPHFTPNPAASLPFPTANLPLALPSLFPSPHFRTPPLDVPLPRAGTPRQPSPLPQLAFPNKPAASNPNWGSLAPGTPGPSASPAMDPALVELVRRVAQASDTTVGPAFQPQQHPADMNKRPGGAVEASPLAALVQALKQEHNETGVMSSSSPHSHLNANTSANAQSGGSAPGRGVEGPEALLALAKALNLFQDKQHQQQQQQPLQGLRQQQDQQHQVPGLMPRAPTPEAPPLSPAANLIHTGLQFPPSAKGTRAGLPDRSALPLHASGRQAEAPRGSVTDPSWKLPDTHDDVQGLVQEGRPALRHASRDSSSSSSLEEGSENLPSQGGATKALGRRGASGSGVLQKGSKKIPGKAPSLAEKKDAAEAEASSNAFTHRHDTDGHTWRKYSHKLLQGSQCERVYYACAEKESHGCKARKIVDRPKVRHWRGDSVRDLVTIDGKHNHVPKPQVNGDKAEEW